MSALDKKFNFPPLQKFLHSSDDYMFEQGPRENTSLAFSPQTQRPELSSASAHYHQPLPPAAPILSARLQVLPVTGHLTKVAH